MAECMEDKVPVAEPPASGPAVTRASRPPGQVIVGLDVGTTSVKAVAFGLGSGWRRVATREYPLLEPRPGWQVQDPEQILAATASALADCVAAAVGAEVLGISLSTAMHGLIALDAAMHPLTPLITWADARAHAVAGRLRQSGQAVDLHRRSGTPVHPMTPLTKLIWFAEHEPRIWAEARWWVGLKDYLVCRLTGSLVTELSSASGTGLLDMAARSWSPATIQLCGVSADQLPPILPTTSRLGLSSTAAGRIGLPVGTPVIVGAADGPLGNLGTGAMSPGTAGLSLGTSGAVRMVVPEPRVDEKGTLFCYALTDTVWMVGAAISNGGFVVRWAAGSLAPDLPGVSATSGADEALLTLAASVPAGSDGLVMVPYLLAERAPLWDASLPGAYLGLRREHTRGHLVRAAVEGVCFQLRLILDELHQLLPVSSVRVTGGTFRSPLWREVMAAVLDRPLFAVGDEEGTSLGAAALGLFALGHAPELTGAVAQLSPPGAPGPPRIDADPELVKIYDRLRASVPELIGSYGRIAELFARSAE
ncbi:MAG TPA: gluconokinase [Candidatus Dormibacteraeota bacterium]|nr:gluconokinase [Candidatus Dormibacteraeota bacterium]